MAQNTKVLLVEGAEDKRALPEVLEANGIVWEFSRGKYVVDIRTLGGVDKLTRTLVSAELKASRLQTLGIVIDADDDIQARWDKVRTCFEPASDSWPKTPVLSGFVGYSEDIRVGIWLMPDNTNRGMLETFLALLIPDGGDQAWDYTETVLDMARKKGGGWKDAHKDKARIHTWLAWQEQPGRQLHQAVKERVLNPKHPNAAVFVEWFKNLYEI